MDTQPEQIPPATPPVTEAPATPPPPSAGSEAPAAAPDVPPVGAAAPVPPVEPPTDNVVGTVESMVADSVKTERQKLLGDLHHIVGFVEEMGASFEAHAMAAIKVGESDVHAIMSRISTIFGEFRNGLLSAGQSMPAKLAGDAAGLVAKAKG